MRFENSVLAKRFTIICLIAAVFGMGFANLVINRPAHANKYEAAQRCFLKSGPLCPVLK
ncbi:MAG: hypothetical protein ACRCU5_08125 [Rhizobiaceae bacterium]